MLDHLGYNVRDFAAGKAFYARALAPLGITIMREGDGWAMPGNNIEAVCHHAE